MSFADELDVAMKSSRRSIRALAPLVPLSAGYLSRVRRGEKPCPSMQIATRLDELLDAEGRLIAAAVAEGLPADRPEVLAQLGMLIHPAETAELARRLRSSQVDNDTTDMLARTVETLCSQYAYRDPLALRTDAHQWLTYTGQLLDGRPGLRQHRDLLVCAGWLTLLAACVEFDSGMASAAEATRVCALQLGREAMSAEITAWAHEIGAWTSFTKGQYAQALAFERAGREIAPHARVAAQLAAHEARTLARTGDQAGALRALDQARAVLAALPAGNNANHFVIDPAKLGFYAMDVCIASGDDEHGEEYAREVLRPGAAIDGQDTSPMRMSQARIALGVVAARRGDLDEAAAYGAAAFDSPRKCVPSLLTAADDLEREIGARWKDARPAREFHDHLRELRVLARSLEK